MRIAYFTHSLRSCWNHGNAHFQRGLLRALQAMGRQTCAFEPLDGWSLERLLASEGEAGLAAFANAYPDLPFQTYDPGAFDAEQALEGFDLVLVHEWTDPSVAAAIGAARARGGRFRLFFHDTHHRAVTAPRELARFELGAFDGVLAFAPSVAEVYERRGWGRRAFVWHEAADVTRFRPPAAEGPRQGLVWIGNWGDGERAAELERFLLAPARDAGLDLDIYGVRYAPEARETLAFYGARLHGWLPNAASPEVYASHLATVHVPRGPYARALPGAPTIRVFEALACGVPLLSAPWEDCEGLFRPNRDFLRARDQTEATRRLRELAAEPELRAALAASGLETIRARHTCAHRAKELLAIVAQLEGAKGEAA